MKTRVLWTKTEIAYLEANHKIKTIPEMMQEISQRYKIERSYSTVKSKMVTMGLAIKRKSDPERLYWSEGTDCWAMSFKRLEYPNKQRFSLSLPATVKHEVVREVFKLFYNELSEISKLESYTLEEKEIISIEFTHGYRAIRDLAFTKTDLIKWVKEYIDNFWD